MSSSSLKPKYRFLISSQCAYGHINTVLGIGELLASHGHEVTFTNRLCYKYLADKRGFKFISFDETLFGSLSPTFLVNWVESIGQKYHLSALESYANWTHEDKLAFASLFDIHDPTNRALEKICHQYKDEFDLFIGDFVYRHPIFLRSPIPFVHVLSMNPLSLYSKGPPFFSGLSVHENEETYRLFKMHFIDASSIYKKKLFDWWKSYDIPPPSEENWWCDIPHHMGIYTYPEKLDYHELGPLLSDKWIRVDAAIRTPDGENEFIIPESLRSLPGKLIFFSLGSLGSSDVQLMKTFIRILSKSPHRFIVSKGPNGDSIELPPNMWGENYVNQLAILEKVDLVITHGGNNSFLETIYFGKPLIVVPFFVDQLDNAQRAVDCEIGHRIDLYNLKETVVLKTIEETLENEQFRIKVKSIAESMKSSKSREILVQKLENFIQNFKSSVKNNEQDSFELQNEL